jgi:hypothetical protein
MGVIRRLSQHAWDSLLRLAHWSMSSVEDKPPVNVIPLPGAAHGPVPAIELRMEKHRRRVS